MNHAITLAIGLILGVISGYSAAPVREVPAAPRKLDGPGIPETPPRTDAAIERRDENELVQIIGLLLAENDTLREIIQLLKDKLAEYEVIVPPRKV